MENLKILFKQTLGFETYDFGWEQFSKIYLDHSGYNVSIYDQEKNNRQHNFIYCMRLPERHLYENFDKKIF